MQRRTAETVGWVTAFTLLGVGVLGYHPYAEDGGVYMAEIKHAIDPALYAGGADFVAGHLGFGGFTQAVAWLVGVFGGRLDWVVLGLDVLCLWGMLLGVWLLAAWCYPERRAVVGAVGLVAVWLGLPVGGTSLYLGDPYLTARSVAVALTVLGLAGVVWKRWLWAGLALAAAVWAHPLMGGYGMAEALLLECVVRRRWRLVGALGALALAGAGVMQALAPAESAEFVRAEITRYYWFLSQWHWFEWAGALAPMGILGWVAVKGREEGERRVAGMAVALGVIALAVAMLFAREGAGVHLVARMQPLRSFQVVYLAMAMVLGAGLGRWLLRGVWWRWLGAFVVLAGSMVMVGRATYPGSDYLELPGVAPRNAWVRAFVWVRQNTPRDALFALDADYIHWDGEDAQGFRAIAERSVLPDAAKDGGVASIRPGLVGAWVDGVKAQTRLTAESDEERMRALAGTGVSWVVLGRDGVTEFACPYANERVKVCRVGWPGSVTR